MFRKQTYFILLLCLSAIQFVDAQGQRACSDFFQGYAGTTPAIYQPDQLSAAG